MSKTVKWIIAIIVIILIIVGVWYLGSKPANAPTSTEPIKIGWSGALTGTLADLGENNMHGVELAVERINAQGGINGRKVEISYQDDKFDGAQTLNNYNKFIFDKVDAVLTNTYGGILSTAQRAVHDKMVVINNIDTSQELADAGDYSFAIGIYDEGIGYTLADFLANNLGDKKTAVLYNQEDPFVKLVKDAFIQKYTELGGKNMLALGYDPNVGDFRTQLTKVKSLNLKNIVIIGFDEQGLLMKQAREVGVSSKFLGIDTFSSETVKTNSKGAVIGSYFTFWDDSSTKVKSFKEEYKNKYGKEPSQILFAVTGYDSMMMLVEAMKKAKTPNGEELKNVLYSLKDYQGLAGDLQMGDDGIVRSIRESIFQVNKDGFTKIN